MKIEVLVYPIIYFGLLAGCTEDPKKPNKQTFKKQLQAYLDKNPYCFMHDRRWSPLAQKSSTEMFPAEFFAKDANHSHSDLIAAGLIEMGPVKNKSYGSHFHKVDLSLTDVGKSVFSPGCLISAKKELVEISEFTIPVAASGHFGTTVSYNYKVTGLHENLTTDKVVRAMPEIQKIVASAKTHLVGELGFVLTSEGWRVFCSGFSSREKC